MTLLLGVLQLLLGLVFALSAAAKLVALEPTIARFRQYWLIPARFAAPLAVAVAALEVLGGVGLLAGVAPRPAALLGATLLVLFVVASSSQVATGRIVECGCFGPLWREHIGPRVVARDCVLAVSAGLLVLGGPPVAVAEASLSVNWLAVLVAWCAAIAVAAGASAARLRAIARPVTRRPSVRRARQVAASDCGCAQATSTA